MRVLVLSVLVVLSGCKKQPTEAVHKTGWHRGNDADQWSCWHPSNYEALATGDRRQARAKNLDAMLSQWNGSRNDGVRFEARLVEDLETVLLGRTEAVEEMSLGNLQACLAAAKSGSTIEWGQWLTRLPAQLTEGECPYAPLDYTLYDYLDIGKDWHIPANVCEGDHILIRASSNDYYQIEDGGPLLNAAGDPDRPAKGDLPCTTEGCLAGQLILRFRADSGVETVVPVGIETRWRAPDHGQITVRINDTSFYDNAFLVEKGIEHHTSIEYSPVDN